MSIDNKINVMKEDLKMSFDLMKRNAEMYNRKQEMPSKPQLQYRSIRQTGYTPSTTSMSNRNLFGAEGRRLNFGNDDDDDTLRSKRNLFGEEGRRLNFENNEEDDNISKPKRRLFDMTEFY
jgi:hypothetical protein